MAAITQLNWADKLARTEPYGDVGYNFISSSPAVAIWGMPEEVGGGYKLQQWSSGSSGGAVGTDLSFSATEGSVDLSTTLHLGMLGEYMKIDKKAVKAGQSLERQMEIQNGFADEGLQSQFVTQLVGSNTGQNGNINSFGAVLGTDAASQADQIFTASGSYAALDILKVINKMRSKIPKDVNRLVLYCPLEAEAHIYDTMVAKGYGPTYSLLDQNFDGSELLRFNGIWIVGTPKLSTSAGTYGGTVCDLYMVGIGGRNGAHLWTDNLATLREVDGPITTAKSVAYGFNALFNVQVHYGSPRAVAKATSAFLEDA